MTDAAGLSTNSSHRQSKLARLAGFWRHPISVAAIFIAGIATVALVWRLAPRAMADKPTHDMLLALVKTHDECCAKPEHTMPGLRGRNLKAIGQRISTQLHDPVLAADLGADGWQFKGACICCVADGRGAHMIFFKDDRQISVFSVPAPKCRNAENCMFKEELNGHMLAGFTRKGRLYCMVGYCPRHALPLDEVASLMQKHQDEMETFESAVAGVAATPAGLVH